MDEVHFVDELTEVLQLLAPPALHVLSGVNTDRRVSHAMRNITRTDTGLATEVRLMLSPGPLAPPLCSPPDAVVCRSRRPPFPAWSAL